MIVLDYQDRRPIYEQIVDKFQLLIIRGVLEPEEQMPSVRHLAMELSINPNTIQKAYAVLEQQGYIYSVKGKGNFVSGKENLAEKKRDAYWSEFEELIFRGQQMGIQKDDFRGKLEKCWKEDGND